MSQWQSTNLKVSKGLIILCEKCGTKLSHPDAAITYSKELQKALKEAIQTSDLKTEIRFTTSSCQGICPDKKIVISFAQNEGVTQFFEFQPTLDLTQDQKLILDQVTRL